MSQTRLIAMAEGLKNFRELIPTQIRGVVEDNEAFIVNMNTEWQLAEEGVTNKGVKIGSYEPYKELTVSIKKVKRQRTDIVTLQDTGDFHNSFFVEAGADQFEIKSSNWKTRDLLAKYGREVLGLTDENIEELIRVYIYPRLLENLKKAVYG